MIDHGEPGTTAFTPGRDIGVIGERTVGLIARDNPSTRERIWSLVAADAALDDILDELSRDGIRHLPDFVLAQREGSAIRVVARGETTVSATGRDGSSVGIDSADVRTWIERVLHDVDTLELSLREESAPVDGLSAEGGFFVSGGSVPASALVCRYPAIDEPVDATSPPEPVAESAEPSEAEEESAPALDTAATAPSEPSAQDPGDAAPAAPPAPPAPAVSGVGVPSGDGDSPGTPVAAVLVFDNGDRVPIDRAVLIGRNPKITGEIGTELPRIVKYDGPSHGLSRTHAEIRPDGIQILVEDLQSTNGTEIQRGDEPREQLVPGHPTPVEIGATIVFGDGLTCVVDAA